MMNSRRIPFGNLFVCLALLTGMFYSAPASAQLPAPVTCVQSALLTVDCAGNLTSSTDTFLLRLVGGVIPSTTSCAPVDCPGASGTLLIDCEIPCNPFAPITNPSCAAVKSLLLAEVALCIDTQGAGVFSWEFVSGSPDSILITANVPFYCCLTTDENSSIELGGGVGHPLGNCPIYNLCDGVNDNEVFAPTAFNGLGLVCDDVPCPLTPSETPTETTVLAPTATETQILPVLCENTLVFSCSGPLDILGGEIGLRLSPISGPSMISSCTTTICPVTDAVVECVFNCRDLAAAGNDCPTILATLAADLFTCISGPSVAITNLVVTTSEIQLTVAATFDCQWCLVGDSLGLPVAGDEALPLPQCNGSILCDGLGIDLVTGGPTATPTSTDVPATETPTPTETNTDVPVTETPTSTETNTEVPATETPTSTETNTEVPATETPTSTETNTEVPATETPTETATVTETPTEPFVCVQSANVNLYCMGEVSPNAQPMRLRLHAGVIPGATCGPIVCDGTPLADVLLDLASLADLDPTDETPFTCETAFGQLTLSIITQINLQAGGSLFATPAGVDSVFIAGETPFYCCICTDEALLSCSTNMGWPIGNCGLFNLGDGIVDNESDFAGFTGGLGIDCIESECPTATPTATNTEVAATETPTEVGPSPTPGCDSGLYMLVGTGQIERVGNPILISGGFNYPDNFAKAMDRAIADDSVSPATEDLVVLDGAGVVSFVENPGDNIVQDFMLDVNGSFPTGRAVDFQMTKSSEGFWVLSDFGGIFRAGDAKDGADPAQVPGTGSIGLGFDVGLGSMRDPNLPNPGGASLRAVAIAVIDVNAPANRADGYIILDSQGGRYQINPDGTDVAPGTYAGEPANSALKLLEPDAAQGGYVYPFFPGLDIARDVDLFPGSEEGLVIFDGWGGIHPVPVNEPTNAVFYTRNEDPNNPGTQITSVGMPYITEGFDDPMTAEDESDPTQYGIDAYSLFVDFDFSAGCPATGFYTLAKDGGVFVFGEARVLPGQLTPAWPLPDLSATFNAVDIELFAFDESETGETMP